ncbi:hypothetical protein OHA72_45705 [Dactylosporangium sp. NBC_01737]|uniref:hypothetical protein n=1 Tax=Dactylosporangium sp. NBC_01737 TaxID=2975959 RepID=UPI002E14AB6C|nr:hypothetical protein OHA72_45705 [Dactylosporangium sp. NBC_01737]
MNGARLDASTVRPVTDPYPGRAVTWLAVRQVRRAAVIVAVLTAGMSAMVAGTYEHVVGDTLDAAALAALAQNPAVRTLFGAPAALDTAGGFTVWRTGTVLGVLLGVWGILTATRISRGEEDIGRWSLLLSGRTPVGAIVVRHLAVIVAALACTGLATGAALTAAGTAPAGAFLHGTGLTLLGSCYAAAGMLSAQVLPSRAAATGAALALLGANLLTRMAADGIDAVAWLRWVSPFGLTALAGPYHADRVAPLIVLAAATAGLTAAVALAAARRDVSGSLLTARTGRPPRLRTLRSVPGFAVRRLLAPLTGWALGIVAYHLLIGLLAMSMTGFLADNPRFADLAAQAGFGGLGTVEGYTATLFALLGIPTGVFCAVRIGALAADESARRLTLILATPVSRTRLVGAEAAVTAAGATALAGAAAAAAWLGAHAVTADLGIGSAVAGAVNALPVAALCLGAAVLALGWLPQAVTFVGVTPAVGGFLLYTLGDSVPAWIRWLSPFAHLARVPAAAPDLPAALAMLGIAATLTVAGVLGHHRRDLRL